jgi:magnesium transporter
MNITTQYPTLGPNACEYCWLIGVAVTFVGQIINNFGTNVVKYSHKYNDQNSINKGWMIFFSGWLLFVIGISFDFISFAYTAQSILGAVASIQFISNLVFARFVLKEVISKYAVLGSICILIGTIIIGASGDHRSPLITSNQLFHFFLSLPFIIWISVLFGTGLILESSYHIINCKYSTKYIEDNTEEENDYNMLLLNEPKRMNRSRCCAKFIKNYIPFIFCFTSSIVGVQTPILGKSMSLLLRDTISGINQFKGAYPYVVGVLFMVFGSVWLWRYNLALKKYNILYVMPVITACYIALNIVGGGIYFQEFVNFTIVSWVIFSIGGCFIITGIVFVSKDTF